MVYDRDRQTDRQTDQATHSVTIGCMYTVLQCSLMIMMASGVVKVL